MKKNVLVLGSGGHAKVVIDVLRASPHYHVLGCISTSVGQKEVLGVPVLGDDTILPRILAKETNLAFIAIGDNAARHRVAVRAGEMGFKLINAISPFSCISPSVALGCGVLIMPGAIVNAGTLIGDNAIVNTGSSIDHDCRIGPSVHISPGCTLAGNVEIGVGVFLGTGCKVVPRMSIGEWSVVGAGSVVLHNVPHHAKAVGIPARVINETSKEQ